MSEFILQCPTVPTLGDSEVRFSLKKHKARRIFEWPLRYVSCKEIIPDQPRRQWGVSTRGARYDSFGGLQLGSPRNNLTLGSRTTHAGAGSRIAAAENQRVGVATLTLGGRVRLKYWNDHGYLLWPIGDGGDQGDTAGFQFSYNLAPHRLSKAGWSFEQFSVTLRLATGIPNRASARPRGDETVYTEVRFPEIDRGDLNLNLGLSRQPMHMDIGLTLNSGQLAHGVQNEGVHGPLGIPYIPHRSHVEAMMYIRVRNW